MNLNTAMDRSKALALLVYPKNASSRTHSKRLLFVQQDESTLSISNAALKYIEDRKEAEKEKIQKAIDDMRAKSNSLKELEASRQDAKARRIAEIKARLRELLDRMRQALMFGDKRAAALIAKEAALLVKEVAAAIREGGGPETDDTPAVPNLDASSETGRTSRASGNNDGSENAGGDKIDTEAANVASEAEQAGRIASLALHGENAGGAEDAKDRAFADSVKGAAEQILAKAKDMASKIDTKGKNNSPVSEKDRQEIIAYLRAIMSMAKATMKSRTNPGNSKSGTPAVEAGLEKEVRTAEQEIEEAIKDIAS